MFLKLFKSIRQGVDKLRPEVGRSYVTREGTPVKLTGRLDPFSRMGMYGYEFIAENGDVYLPDGRFMRGMRSDRRDLVAYAE